MIVRTHATAAIIGGMLILCAVLTAPSVSALKPEDGPQYLTDSHGAAGVAWAMLSLSKVDPKYMECFEQTLAWLMHIEKTDEKGRVVWHLSDSAPEAHPNHNVAPPGLPLPIIMFFDAYEKTKRPEYKETGLAAARWVADVGSNKWGTDLGLAYGWSFSFGQKDVGLISGHSHGLGKYLQLFVRAHKVEPDPVFEKALRGILVNLKTHAVAMDNGMLAWPAYKWPNLKDKKAFITGFCYGQAGVIIPLVDLAAHMPDMKLDDGTRPLDLANGALRYLVSQARPMKKGYVWPYMRNNKNEKNPGLGSGVGGIGWAFLQGYRANRAAGNDAFANECMTYARGAAEYALSAIEQAKQEDIFKTGGGAAGFGVCGGGGGTAWLPMLLAEEIGEQDPEFRERVKEAAGRIARLLIAHAVPVGDTLAWPLSAQERSYHQVKSGSETVNIALDYGQTGVALSLCEMGKFLNDEEILNAARKAGDFIVNNAVKTEHGWKVPRFVTVQLK